MTVHATCLCDQCQSMKSTRQQIEDIQKWLANRPSPTMDPAWDEVLVKKSRLRELKARCRTTERPPSRMLEAQRGEECDS